MQGFHLQNQSNEQARQQNSKQPSATLHTSKTIVVPLSIRAHFCSSCYLLSLDKFFTGMCRNVHADIPSRRGPPYHGRDKLSFPEWIVAPQALWGTLPAWGFSWIASSQKLEELWTQNAQPCPACTDFQHCHCPCSARSILRLQLPIHNSFTNTPSLSCREGTRNDWRNEHIKCLLPSSKRWFNSSLFYRTSWLSTKPTALWEPFPHSDRLGIIDMWGMTKDYTCRTGWKLGRDPALLSQSTQCQMASSNSTHSRDTALPVLLRGGGKKVIKIILSGCWLSTTHGVSSNNHCAGQGWEGYLMYLTNELWTSCVHRHRQLLQKSIPSQLKQGQMTSWCGLSLPCKAQQLRNYLQVLVNWLLFPPAFPCTNISIP